MKKTHLKLVGDLICPGVDVDEWCAKNRAPIFPGKQNVWVFAYANDEGLTKSEITQRLYSAFEFWFDSHVDLIAATEDRAKIGEADSVKVTYIGEALPKFTSKFIARKESLETPPTIKSNKITYVVVQFDYRGVNRDIVWPIETVLGNDKVKYYCPNNSEWALQAIIESEKNVEPERSDGDVIGDIASNAGTVITDTLGTLKTPLLIASGVASLLAIAYIVGKLK